MSPSGASWQASCGCLLAECARQTTLTPSHTAGTVTCWKDTSASSSTAAAPVTISGLSYLLASCCTQGRAHQHMLSSHTAVGPDRR